MFQRIKNFLFVNSSAKQMIMKNSFWFGLGTAVTKVARALIIIYVAKILGTENFGIFTYALSLVGIFMIFADLGLTSILTRELSKDNDEKHSYLSTAFFVKIGFLLFTLLLAAVFGPLISKFQQAIPLVLIIAVFVATESLRSFLYAITRAENKMQTEAGLGIIAEIISVIVIMVLFLRSPSATTLAFAFVIGNLLGLVITIAFLRKNFTGIFKHFKSSLIMPIVRSSWPFAVIGVFGALMTNIDSIMIGFWNEPSVLGVYAAAQKPISLLYVLPGFLSISLLPFISRLVADARAHTGAVIEKSYRASLLLALPIVFGGIMLAGPLITVTFGDEYAGAMLTFQILLLTLIPAFPGAVFTDVILAEDRQKIFIKSTAFGGVTNVILNFLLIPTYGIAGSAVATLVAQLVMNGILYAKVRKSYQTNVWRGTSKILMASILMSLAVYLLTTWSTPLIIILPVAAILYAGLLYMMKEEIVMDIKQSLAAK